MYAGGSANRCPVYEFGYAKSMSFLMLSRLEARIPLVVRRNPGQHDPISDESQPLEPNTSFVSVPRPVLQRSPGPRNPQPTSGAGLEVTLPAALPVTGVVLSDQVKSLDWRVRRAERICALPRPAVMEVLQKLGALLVAPDYPAALSRLAEVSKVALNGATSLKIVNVGWPASSLRIAEKVCRYT